MTAIPAGQLLFTQVSAERSPAGRRGEQTVFCSRRDGPKSDEHPRVCPAPEEVLEIEERLFYHPPPGRPVKHLFFRTRRKKVVLARLIALPGADAAGREGLYFAHALVFDPGAFDEGFRGNPFPVFDSFQFWEGLEDVPGAETDWETADLRPATIEATPAEDRTAPPPPLCDDPEHLRKLFLLASRAEGAAPERPYAVAFHGPSEKMLPLLRNLFAYLPPPLRLRCSFDTLFSEGSLSRTPYWGIGLPPDRRCPPDAHAFDLDRRCFAFPFECSPQTPYQRWLDRVLWEDGGMARVWNEGGTSYECSRRFGRLEGGPRPGRKARPDGRLASEYLQLHPQPVSTLLRGILKAEVGMNLTEEYAPRFLALGKDPEGAARLWQVLEEGSGGAMLGKWLYDDYLRHRRKDPEVAGLKGLQKLCGRLKGRDAPWLGARLWMMVLRRAGRWKELSDVLEEAKEEDVDWFLGWALASISGSYQANWCIYRYEHGLAFGPRVHCRQDDDLRLLDALLGASRPEPREDAGPGSPGKGSRRKGRGPANPQAAAGGLTPLEAWPIPPGPERRTWLIEVVDALKWDDGPKLRAWEEGARPQPAPAQWTWLLNDGNWEQLWAELRSAKEAPARAFAAKALTSRTWMITWCVWHPPDGLFFGPFVRVDHDCPDRILGLFNALLNIPWGQKPTPLRRARTGSNVSSLPVPRDADLSEGGLRRWPRLVELLVRSTGGVALHPSRDASGRG